MYLRQKGKLCYRVGIGDECKTSSAFHDFGYVLYSQLVCQIAEDAEYRAASEHTRNRVERGDYHHVSKIKCINYLQSICL